MNNGTVAADTVAALKKMHEQDEAARNFFEWAANRQNDATQTSIDYLAQRAVTDRRRAIEIARELEELGCGQFLVGRRGAKSRIVWEVSLKSIGRAAMGQGRAVESLDPELVAETVDLKDEAQPGATLTIAGAKKQLAEALGVPVEAIEITVRA